MARQPARNAHWALVTGASSGIGKATAGRLASQGWNLVLLSRRLDRLKDHQVLLRRQHGVDVEVRSVEQSDVAGFRLAVELADKLGTLRLVVLAAGHGKGAGVLGAADASEWHSAVADNLSSTISQVDIALSVLNRHQRGRIVVVGSIHSHRPAPGQSVYAGYKYGLRGFLESVRLEEASRSIGISLVNPGATNTEFADVANGIAEPKVHDLAEWRTRPLLAEDVAAAVVWISELPERVDIPSLTIEAKAADNEAAEGFVELV